MNLDNQRMPQTARGNRAATKATPSPPSDGGEGRGEEGRLLPLAWHAVLKAIQFNRKPSGRTVEIERIFPGRMLTPELKASKATRPKCAPKLLLFPRLLRTQTPRVGCLIHVPDNSALKKKDKRPLSPALSPLLRRGERESADSSRLCRISRRTEPISHKTISEHSVPFSWQNYESA